MKTKILSAMLLIVIVGYSQENPVGIPKDLKPEDRICFALYTVHEKTLKLTAQFYPILNYEPFEAQLEIEENGKWKEVAKAEITYPGYIAPFRVENWDDTKEVRYRVAHNKTAYYDGIIRKNPIHKDEFVMATFSCNSTYKSHGGDIPRRDIVNNINKLQPDLLFFSGDQVYDHSQHYLYWLKFGKDFGDIIRNTPTITIPDDHDVGQANLWGANGKKATSRRGISGGYYMPASYVNEVQMAQTSHLPDPYDPTPVEQGIGVYYTDLTWGGLSFAILEDRKFKSGLEGIVEINGKIYEAIEDPKIDTKIFDKEGTTLLGERQLDFLENWTTDWKDAEMKSVLSQTIFSMVNNYSGKHEKELAADFDTNGWPQTGRNNALSVIRKSFSCMVAGDQHLASVVQHGINDWGDAGFSFATPALANLWTRWWDPSTKGNNQKPGQPYYTGEYYDGFKNKMTVLAVANPPIESKSDGNKLTTRAAGIGIVRYNKKDRTITFECWPREVDIFSKDSKQYPGWPITISQKDNYNPKDSWELPTLNISKPNQVVTVIDEGTKEVYSSIRIKGNTYRPKVMSGKTYSIKIGEGSDLKVLSNLSPKKKNGKKINVTI